MLPTDARRTQPVRRRRPGPAARPGPGPAGTVTLIAEGHALVRDCLARERATGEPPGRYQPLAAVNAVHTDAADAADTDWAQIAALYELLVRIDGSPIVRLNRAVAVAELDGPSVALAEVERLGRSTATTPGTPPGPTCCGGSAGRPSRARRTTRRSRPPARRRAGLARPAPGHVGHLRPSPAHPLFATLAYYRDISSTVAERS